MLCYNMYLLNVRMTQVEWADGCWKYIGLAGGNHVVASQTAEGATTQA